MPLGVNWSAIASTATVDARNNARVVAPVYLFDSSPIASGFGDMWDGNLSNPISRTQFGGSPNVDVWTGTGSDGFKNGELGLPGGAPATLGNPFASDGGQWIGFEDFNNTSFNSLYALSEKLTVPSVKAKIKLNIEFTDPPNVAALDSFGLSEFPEEVLASFVLGEGTSVRGGGTSFLVSDVMSADVAFGDGLFTSLSAFNLDVNPDGSISSLSWRFNPIATPSVENGIIMMNSPLGISGMNRSSGQSFSYQYGNSVATISAIPEPSTLAICLGFGSVGVFRRRLRA